MKMFTVSLVIILTLHTTQAYYLRNVLQLTKANDYLGWVNPPTVTTTPPPQRTVCRTLPFEVC